MEFIETERGMRSIDLDKVEAIEKFGESQTQLITATRIHLINLPYSAVLNIIRERAKATSNIRKVIENIDSNTQAFRG